MKKILMMIVLFISFFFINNINAKAYWKIKEKFQDDQLHLRQGECEKQGSKFTAITYKLVDAWVGAFDATGGLCYSQPVLVNSDKLLNKCTLPIYYDEAGTYYLRKGTVSNTEYGCPDGYFYVEPNSEIDLISNSFASNYKHRCIPCANYDLVVGTKKTYDGKTCYIASNKTSACPEGLKFWGKWNTRELYCSSSMLNVDGYQIIESTDGFSHTFKYIGGTKINGVENGTKVCKDGYSFINGYCYECRAGEQNGSEDLDCKAFQEITDPIWTAIKIIAPILVVVLGALDFLRATAASDEKEMKKATSNFVKRLIMLALLFLLTYLINFIVGFVGFQDLTACL